MKVAVLGASGRAGSEITKELAARKHQVIAIARAPQKIRVEPTVDVRAGDASNPAKLADIIRGCDAVISALHFDVSASSLLQALRLAGVPRLLVTGGAGSLEVAPGKRLVDAPDFPAEWKAGALQGATFLDDLRREKDIDWTFFSPAAVLFEGPRLGHYRLGSNQLVTDARGESRISFADYAIAMVDELEHHHYPRQRFTAAY